MSKNCKYPWFKPTNYKNKNILSVKKNILKNQMSMGFEALKLENELKKILKTKHVILTNNGTSALMMAFLALDVKKKTKILCTDMTWTATINPGIIAGANIKLVDTNNSTQNVSYEKLNREIKIFKPQIVILVHLNGEVIFDEEFNNLKKKYKFKVIEDSAQAFLSKSKKNILAGTKYEIGCFSLSITKIIHMVYGGFCSTNSNMIAKKLTQIRNNGVNETENNFFLSSLKIAGGNFKPSNLHASIGLINLKNKEYIKKKVIEIHSIYSKNIVNDKIQFLKRSSENFLPIYNLAIVKNRKKFIQYCHSHRINLHLNYRALHESKILKTANIFPNSKFISDSLVRLPSGPGYSYSEIKKIVKIINNF